MAVPAAPPPSRRLARLAALLPALLVGLAPLARADDEAADRWRDPAVLQGHLDQACQAVEEVCGAKFRRRPMVKVSSQEEIEQILRTRLDGERGMLESTPNEARSFVAYYEPILMEVHVVPQALVQVAQTLGTPELLDEDVLRIILVHEATHALDFQRFPVRWVLACCSASDERLAIEAVLEGHAQLVAEEVSRKWGVEDAFQRLTRLYTGAPPGDVEDDDAAFDQEASFVYIAGHAFMRTLKTALGQAGMEAALRDPPCETRVIDRPLLYLEPEKRGTEPDLQAVLEVFRPLVTRPSWEVSKWRVLGDPVGALPETTPGPGGEPEALEGYLDNHGLYAGAPDGNRYVNVFLAHCRTVEEAERFVSALERVDRARDADPEWQPAVRRRGAGTGQTLAGFTSRRRARGGDPRTELTLHVARVGSQVIELSAYGIPAGERTRQEQVLDLAARLLNAPPSTAAAIHLRAQVRAFLAARTEEDVARARILMSDLLPTEADLRRVVRPEHADRFSKGYRGTRLLLRTTPVQNATIFSAFREATLDTKVRAWAATTEELVAGKGRADQFPPEMIEFARTTAAPGVTWLVLVLTPKDGAESTTYRCFARLGDRFLWIREPWTAMTEPEAFPPARPLAAPATPPTPDGTASAEPAAGDPSNDATGSPDGG